MLLPFVMAGFCFALLCTVLVKHLFLLNTSCLVQKVGYLLFNTMKWEILQLHYWLECVLKWPLNLSCSQFPGRIFSNVQDGARLDIVMNGFWGEGQSVHLLMFIFNSFAPSKLMQPVSYQLAIRNMKTWRREHMEKGSEKLSMLHLLLWLCQPPVDWLMRQHIFTNILLPCCLISEGMSILL